MPGDAIILHKGTKNHDYNIPLNQKFEKMKKTPTDTIILHMNNKNYNHIMYGSWDMVCDGWTGRGTGRQTDGKGDK